MRSRRNTSLIKKNQPPKNPQERLENVYVLIWLSVPILPVLPFNHQAFYFVWIMQVRIITGRLDHPLTILIQRKKSKVVFNRCHCYMLTWQCIEISHSCRLDKGTKGYCVWRSTRASIVTNAFSDSSRKLLSDVNGQRFSGVWHNFPQPQSNLNYILIMFRVPDP